jgi:hypothetical protein
MRINNGKTLAILGTTALTLLMFAPLNAATAFQPKSVDNVEEMATLIVINNVINDEGGTLKASDFMMTVSHFGSEVTGSPFPGSETGTVFRLAPGTHVVYSPIIDGYLGSWSGIGITNGFVDLQPGQTVVMTRTTRDFAPYSAAVDVPGVVVEVPTTEEGGELPATSSPWFNVLAAALLVSATGAFGLRRSSLSE